MALSQNDLQIVDLGPQNKYIFILFDYLQYLEDPRFSLMMNKINTVIHEEARYQKGSIQMRSQKCFAVKVGHLDPVYICTVLPFGWFVYST